MRRAAAGFLLLALGCSSSGPRIAREEPEITVRQISNVADAARQISGNITVQYSVTIHNTTSTLLTLKRADLQSIGAGAYTLPPTSKPFNVVLSPGETQTVELWAPAVIEDVTVAGANGPVTIRGILQFDSPTGQFQSVVVQQVHASGGV